MNMQFFTNKLGIISITVFFVFGVISSTIYLLRDQIYTRSIDSLMASVISGKAEETHESDKAEMVLMSIKNGAGMPLSQIGPTDFIWKIEGESEVKELMIEGRGMNAVGITADNVFLEESLEQSGFFEDALNTVDGSIGSLKGYKRSDMVCLISEIISGFDINNPEILPADKGKKDVEMQCGIIDQETVPELSKEGSIKKLFAKKYNVSTTEVSLTMNDDSDEHVRGLVQIGEPGPGSTGIFLATLIKGEWRLIFDGNGRIPCEQVEGYGFPGYMTDDCEESLERTGFMPQEESLVRQALSEQIGIASTSIIVRFEQQTDEHMRGTWHLENEEKELRTFYAVNDDSDSWKIVSDGRGEPDCLILEEYDFPAIMKSDCIDNQ